MDLLATVRKEGSRGGRGDFKWSDVQSSGHRENYLGHSLMAPVGRWQKGRDLNWYAKGDSESNVDEDPAARAARERKEEIRRVKEAEEDALARALGLPVAPRNNPNMEELGARREVGNALADAAVDEDAGVSRGVGYGRPAGMSAPDEGQSTTERLAGTVPEQDKELQYALKEYKRRHAEAEADADIEIATTGTAITSERGMDTTAAVIAIPDLLEEKDLDVRGRDRVHQTVIEITSVRNGEPEVTPHLMVTTKAIGQTERDQSNDIVRFLTEPLVRKTRPLALCQNMWLSEIICLRDISSSLPR